MYANARITENKQAAVDRNTAIPRKSTNTQLFKIKDKRPEAITQRKQQSAISESANELIQTKTNNTGLPNNLKSGIENLSGYAMDDVKVHYNSAKPSQLQAYAYTQGTDIHVAPGQEKHLPHEAWHVVQQKQGRVRPTRQLKGIHINDNAGLEKEADVMGSKALSTNGQSSGFVPDTFQLKSDSGTIQRFGKKGYESIDKKYEDFGRLVVATYRIIGNISGAFENSQTKTALFIALGATLEIITSKLNINSDFAEKGLGAVASYLQDDSIEQDLEKSIKKTSLKGNVRNKIEEKIDDIVDLESIIGKVVSNFIPLFEPLKSILKSIKTFQITDSEWNQKKTELVKAVEKLRENVLHELVMLYNEFSLAEGDVLGNDELLYDSGIADEEKFKTELLTSSDSFRSMFLDRSFFRNKKVRISNKRIFVRQHKRSLKSIIEKFLTKFDELESKIKNWKEEYSYGSTFLGDED
jgi:hypothetical protein